MKNPDMHVSVIRANVKLLNPWKSFAIQCMVVNLQNNSTQYKEPIGILCQISISEIRQSSYPIVSLNWASNLSRTSDPRLSWIMHGNSITCPISPQQRGLGHTVPVNTTMSKTSPSPPKMNVFSTELCWDKMQRG